MESQNHSESSSNEEIEVLEGADGDIDDGLGGSDEDSDGLGGSESD